MKKIITHINPDLDAITSCWLIKRFLPGWEKAEIDFVPATNSFYKIPGVDEDPNILYVDVGRGKLDHHDTGDYLSATKLCWEYIKSQRKEQKLSFLEENSLEKIVDVVTQIDNARDLNWEEVNKERYQFYFHLIIEGLRGCGEADSQVMEFGFRGLDAILLIIKSRTRADEELTRGIVFQTRWGKAIGLESKNRQVLLRGEEQGYVLVVKKDPESGGVQIYSRWDSSVDLSEIYSQVKKLDPNSDWFLHSSKKLLLNQAGANPHMRPTKLSLSQIIALLKK